MKSVIEHGREKLRWGPLDGTYASLTGTAQGVVMKFYDVHHFVWPGGVMMANGDRWQWVQDWDRLVEQSFNCFQELIFPVKKRNAIRAAYDDQVARNNAFAKQVYAGALDDLADDAFLAFFDDWFNNYITFWAHSAPCELSTWGTVEYFKQALQENELSPEQRAQALEALTAPAGLSFFQKADAALLRVLLQAKQGNGEPSRQALQAYLHDWYWLDNSYAGARRRTLDDVQKQIHEFTSSESTLEQLLEGLNAYPQRIDNRRQEVQERYDLPDGMLAQSRALGVAVSWQDERKGEMFKQMDVLFTIMQDYADRFNVPLNDVHWCDPKELIPNASSTGTISSLADERRGHCAIFFTHEKFTTIGGAEAIDYITEFWEDKPTGDELKGTVASFGRGSDECSGSVTVIHSAYEKKAFPEGVILVSAMTTPEFMPIIRKAKAIITDEGGLTAHAAVVAREMGIPCIVGTKFATKLLNDGERVTMNLQTGEITKNT